MEKMNILITGPSGFLAKELVDSLGSSHNILPVGRVDITDEAAVKEVLTTNKVDVVIHTATRGGKRTRQDTFQDLVDNIDMFNNLVKYKNYYKIMFCFCSGASYNREETIDSLSEAEVLTRKPFDYYGLSKNLIAREALKHSNIINLRLFGCFGRHEEKARFFSSMWDSLVASKKVEIHQNKKMDFFSARDVGKVIQFYMDNFKTMDLPTDLNLVYPKKLSLLELFKIFTTVMMPSRSEYFEVLNEQEGDPYTGDGSKLASLGIPLEGLVGGLVHSYGGDLV